MSAWAEQPPCSPGQHTFRRTDDTNEPVGRCIRCEVSLAWAEAQEEDAEPLAYADVPEQDLPAYYAALDAEAVALGR